MGTHKVIDFSKYKGWYGSIRGYASEHRLLVLQVQREVCDCHPEFILCDYCLQLPSKFSWMVDDLRIHMLDDDKCLLTDWRQGFHVICRSVLQREGFDLGRWMLRAELWEDKWCEDPFIDEGRK